MVEVRMRIDDGRHRLVGHRLDLSENRRTGARQHRVDQHHALVGDEHQRVASGPGAALAEIAAGQEVQVVPQLLDLANRLRLLLQARRSHGKPTDRQERNRDCRSSHVAPPGTAMVTEIGCRRCAPARRSRLKANAGSGAGVECRPAGPQGRIHVKQLLAFLAAVTTAAVSLAAQSGMAQATMYGRASGWTVPRTAEGKPDLQGVWANNGVTPMTRPAQWKGKEFLTDAEVKELKSIVAALRERERRRHLRRSGPARPQCQRLREVRSDLVRSARRATTTSSGWRSASGTTGRR